MKNLLIITGILMAMFATIGSASAMWNWQGQWLENEKWNSQCLDVNENDICDGQEDDDGDGVLNRDEEDFEKQQNNMNDDDGDGIANKDDEDYEGQVWTGNQNMSNGNGIRNQDWKLSRKEKKNELKWKMWRNGSMVEWFINGYLNKVWKMSQEQQQEKLEKLVSNIDVATQKIETMPEGEKKELYLNVLEYFQISAEEVLEDILESIE